MVGPGAFFVLNDLMMTFLRPNQGDEVIIFEPCYPCYYDHIQYAGGIVKGASLELKDGDWIFNEENFRKVLSSKTKILILNNA